MVGLALEAGGVKGFTHIATLKLLDMYDVRLNMIAGSSAGAIVGALYAMYGDADKVYEEFSTNVVSFMKDKSLKSSVPMFELVIKKA
ncbi:MAG TPA: patatin-like phospholipase family protein, partial [Fervidobacterium sp.]|nr:patatin-like phospholipase family protein [Fervidobacterium sp.]